MRHYYLGPDLYTFPCCSLSKSRVSDMVSVVASLTCPTGRENPQARIEWSSLDGLVGSRDCRAACTSPMDTSLRGSRGEKSDYTGQPVMHTSLRGRGELVIHVGKPILLQWIPH